MPGVGSSWENNAKGSLSGSWEAQRFLTALREEGSLKYHPAREASSSSFTEASRILGGGRENFLTKVDMNFGSAF